VRHVLHEFADDATATNDAGTANNASRAGKTFPEAIAKKLLVRAGEGEDRILLYVDNHLRPYTGKHTIRKGWRMQSKRAVPGTTEYYVHDEGGCPLFRLETTSHDSLCDWLMPVVDFANLALGGEVKPLLFFDRGGAFPEVMAELRNADAEFATYERKPYPELGATEFKESLEIVLASKPREPIRIAYTEAPNKNLREGRGRVRRIALLTEDGAQINLLAVSTLPAEALIRGLLARWGRQENQFKHEVERWGINHLDGRRVEEYPPDALIPNPERRKLDRLLKLSHTAEGEAWRKWMRLKRGDPARSVAKRDGDRAMERQRDLMALRASVPRVAPVKDTPLAGKLRRHELGYYPGHRIIPIGSTERGVRTEAAGRGPRRTRNNPRSASVRFSRTRGDTCARTSSPFPPHGHCDPRCSAHRWRSSARRWRASATPAAQFGSSSGS
jgi:hypothetical protein